MDIERVRHAYRTLKAKGVDPSTRGIHQLIGYGSRRDVVKLLREVKWMAEGGSVCPICDALYREQYPRQATCLSYECGKEFNRRRQASI
jgi:hypothetical protein